MSQFLGAVVSLALFALVIWAAIKHARAAVEKAKTSGFGPSLPYRKKDYLLSRAERSLYEVLRRSVASEWTVFAKVRLLDLVWMPRGTSNFQSHRNRIQSKHVDFVLCDPSTLGPVLVIELDDSSHERADRQERDAFVDAALRAAGLPILHVRARDGYVTADLSRAIREKVGMAAA